VKRTGGGNPRPNQNKGVELMHSGPKRKPRRRGRNAKMGFGEMTVRDWGGRVKTRDNKSESAQE